MDLILFNISLSGGSHSSTVSISRRTTNSARLYSVHKAKHPTRRGEKVKLGGDEQLTTC